MLLLCTPLFLKAQSGISGTMSDSVSGSPISFGTVRLLKAAGAGFVSATRTDSIGHFILQDIKPGNYYLEITYLGYKPYRSKPMQLQDKSEVLVLGTIYMQGDKKNLNTVTVLGKQQFIEKGNNKLILNVSNSVLGASSTANELLQQVPGLSATDNGQMRLNGKAGVTVMVDGKISPLPAGELAAFLQNMPGGSISRIEVVSNPTAGYDAAGRGGIINIITKKNTKAGINGSATAGYNQGIYPNLTGSFLANARMGRFNFFGSYSYNRMRKAVDFKLDRNVQADGPLNFHQEMYFRPLFNNHVAKAGLDFELDHTSSIGFTFDINAFRRDRTIDDITHISGPSSKTDSIYETKTRNIKHLTNTAYNFYYTKRFDSLGHKLEINYTYSRFNNLDDRFSYNYYSRSDGSELKPSNALRNNVPFVVANNVLRADYTLPFNTSTTLEAGVKGGWIKQKNDLIYDSLSGGQFVNIPDFNTHFTYDESILAAYGNLSKRLGKYDLSAGVRLERTSSSADFVTSKLKVAYNYLDYFPGLSAARKFGEHSLKLAMNKRIGRPSYQDLDPTLIYFNQYYYLQGNPSLTPEYTHTYSFSDIWKGDYAITLSYARTTNPLVSIQEIEEGTNVNILSVTNLDVLNNLSLSVDIPVTITKWWSSYNNAYCYIDQTKADNYLGVPYDRHLSGYGFSTSHTFTAPANLKFEMQFKYDSPQLFGFNKMDAIYNLTVGAQKGILKKKANIKLSVYDLLNSMKFVYRYDYANVKATEARYVDYRQLRVSFTYNFGSKPARNRKSSEMDNGNERLKIQ
nr:outer membrane beta-barrel protein [[Flexibacter] sp. ATCC 35208]